MQKIMNKHFEDDKETADIFFACVSEKAGDWNLEVRKPKEVTCATEDGRYKNKWVVEVIGNESSFILAILKCC